MKNRGDDGWIGELVIANMYIIVGVVFDAIISVSRVGDFPPGLLPGAVTVWAITWIAVLSWIALPVLLAGSWGLCLYGNPGVDWDCHHLFFDRLAASFAGQAIVGPT